MSGDGLREYEVKVTAITTLTVQAASEEEAIDRACGLAWEYDADELSGEIIKAEEEEK